MSSSCGPFKIVLAPNAPFVIYASRSGPRGPTGARGPSGAGGKLLVVTADSTIPSDQYYTVVNAAANTVQTLPLITDVLVDGISTPFVVNNYSGHQVQVEGAGSDLVQGDAFALLRYQGQSITLLPTTLGWLVI